MVFAPESGYKFEVSVEKSCTPQADALWKLVFDLYKRQPAPSTNFDQIVHVSYTAQTPVQSQNIQNMAINGVSAQQADILINQVHPAVKGVENAGSMTPDQFTAQKQLIQTDMSKVANVVSIND
jgi:hypothetical protein